MDADAEQFVTDFQLLTRNPPFPWQVALWKRLIQGPASIPKRCDIPTGLGKTAVIAVWLLARRVCLTLPRRLVYVVNRRTVVDQTTAEVERYKAQHPDLAISTLRGQFADNRAWSADPSSSAVICGTVDMIGSRLLFSGYGIGMKSKPLHAGFLGQDSLFVHDEAHLEPAFQELLNAIASEQKRTDPSPIRVMALSATGREAEGADVVCLSPDDRANPEVHKRIHSTKALTLHPVADEKSLPDKLVELARSHESSGRAVLVFVSRLESVGKVVDGLKKPPVCQLTGTMRGWERDQLVNDAIFRRFLPGAVSDGTTVYLVCTSAGEVGVNLSADHLVCDLTPFDSMAQRFGRVNRFGKQADTKVDVVYPVGFDPEKPLDVARERTLSLLRQLQGNASPAALGELPAKARLDAFTPPPTILPVTDILFDAWSLTSVPGKLPGRPPVEPYLHGVTEWEPPQTQVAWRKEVNEITGDLLGEYPPEELLEAFPLKPHELLKDRTDRVVKELYRLSERDPDRPVWIVSPDGTVNPSFTLKTLAAQDRKRVESVLAGQAILLPHDVGGLTPGGLFDGGAQSGDAPIDNDVSERLTDQAGNPDRIRVYSDDAMRDAKTARLRLVMRVDFPADDDEQAEPSWLWYERPLPADSRHSINEVLLADHTRDVESYAAQIARNLGLPEPLKSALLLAARGHDLGKHRDRWQGMIGRPSSRASEVFAKSARTWRGTRGLEYRHEFGSLLDVAALPEFAALDDHGKDLVLHLIAAHHGMARPHFESEQTLDDNHPEDTSEAVAVEVPRRFARLQRKYGRWGLAYLESLLRAADWAASANPSPATLSTEEASR